jgi:hypothetical protein
MGYLQAVLVYFIAYNKQDKYGDLFAQSTFELALLSEGRE